MRKTLIDRAIAHFAPVHAAKRMHARGQMAAFEALTSGGGSSPLGPAGSRLGLLALGRDAQADLMPTLALDRAESRNLARFSPIAVGAINTNVGRVVGTGLALVAAPHQAVLGWSDERALAWKSKVQAEFSLWADGVACDYYGKQNFCGLQALVLRASLESGDAFSVLPDEKRTPMMPYALRVQILEADRVGNPAGQMDSAEISGGIKVDAGGRPIEAHIYKRHPGAAFLQGSELYAGSWQTFAGPSGRLQLLHHMRQLRPGQLRGVPYLAPIVESLKKLERYSQAEMTAALVSAMFTVFVKTPTGGGAPIFQGDDPNAQQKAEATGELALGNGAIVGLAPGEEVEMADPNRPNPNFDAFVTAVLTQIGMALGIPREMLMKVYNASYSASKAAWLDAWQHFRDWRNWLTLSFCQPVYETWLTEAVANGRIDAPGFFTDPLLRWAYTRAEWRGDSMGSINPKDEVAAYSAAIDARLTTRERAEWELFGTDFDATLGRKTSEHKRLESAGILPAPKAGAAAAPAPAKGDAE
jgi:lambda family phage portal protein